MRPRTAPPIIDVNDLLASLPGKAKTGRSWFESELDLLRQLNPIERLVLQATIVNSCVDSHVPGRPTRPYLEGVVVSSRAREAAQFAGHRCGQSNVSTEEDHSSGSPLA